jgi:hypothetical protein
MMPTELKMQDFKRGLRAIAWPYVGVPLASHRVPMLSFRRWAHINHFKSIQS